MSEITYDPEYVDFHYIKQRYSIGRTKAYQLLREGKIASKRLLSEGKDTGRTLINLDSVKTYLNSLPSYDFVR
jgi:hypothetical protein